jgi:hypothetical protein
VGIPFDIPPGETRNVRFQYNPPNSQLTEEYVGESDVTLFFDHPQFRKSVTTVTFRIVPNS